MKETPLLMKGPLVLAALQRRKTQTRRVINPQPKGPSKSQLAKCPYGRPGDVLWVRETLRRVNGLWVYAADHSPVVVDKAHQSAMVVWTHHKDRDYCPSIHMPRWAARVLLTVKDVRVERVQDITESDAAAEGVEPFTMTEQGVADIQISDESPELKLLAKLLGPGSPRIPFRCNPVGGTRESHLASVLQQWQVRGGRSFGPRHLRCQNPCHASE